MVEPEIRLAALRSELIGTERTDPQAGRSILLRIEEAAILSEVRLEAGHSPTFFGHPLVEALKQGYRLTRRGAFEFTNGAAAQDTSRRLDHILDKFPLDRDQTAIMDAFAGTGQVAYALLQTSPLVATEADPFTYGCLVHNLGLSQSASAGMNPKLGIFNYDSTEFIDKVQPGKLAAIYLDPPWNGRFHSNSGQTFKLEHTTPSADRLVLLALSKSPVAALKLPITADLVQIDEFCKTEDLHALIDMQIAYPKHPRFNQLTAYFTNVGIEQPNVGSRIAYSDRILNAA